MNESHRLRGRGVRLFLSLSMASFAASTLMVGPGVDAATEKHHRNLSVCCKADQERVSRLVQQLIAAENRHDIPAVRSFVWESPTTLFVAKTETAEEGNWAGFWGADVVTRHFRDLYQGTFHMAPDYGREKTASLAHDVIEVYLPVTISVAYGGQDPAPKPFIVMMDWVRTKQGWRMATDIALPIPPAPPKAS